MTTKYTKEFKSEALRLGECEGGTAASEKLGISVKALYGSPRTTANYQRQTALQAAHSL